MVDTHGLGPCAVRHGGSSPLLGTMFMKKPKFIQQIQSKIHALMRSSRDAKIALMFHLLGWIWTLGVCGAVLRVIYTTLTSEATLYLGWKRVVERYSPFHVLNIFLIILLLVPTICAFLAREHFLNKHESKT